MTEAADFSKAAQIAEDLATVYRLLALGFLFPAPEITQGILNGAFQTDLAGALTNLVEEKHRVETPLMILKQFEIEHTHQGEKATTEELNIEYVRLFIGPGTPLVAPYESAYDGSAGVRERYLLMVSTTAAQLENSYLQAGVTVTADLNEPPDHIATELEFMFYLHGKEVAAWREGDRPAATRWRQQALAFLNEHLGKWVPSLCCKIEKESHNLFYTSLASIILVIMTLGGTQPTGRPCVVGIPDR